VSAVQPVPDVWACQSCGNPLEASCPLLTPGMCRIDAEAVTHRLERAGETLLRMRLVSPLPAPVRSAMPDCLHEWVLAYGWSNAVCRPALPDARAITAMDATYGWLAMIPDHRRVLRRIVGLRSLVDPQSGRHVVHWRRLSQTIGAEYRSVQRWHAQGVALIVEQLAGGNPCSNSKPNCRTAR